MFGNPIARIAKRYYLHHLAKTVDNTLAVMLRELGIIRRVYKICRHDRDLLTAATLLQQVAHRCEHPTVDHYLRRLLAQFVDDHQGGAFQPLVFVAATVVGTYFGDCLCVCNHHLHTLAFYRRGVKQQDQPGDGPHQRGFTITVKPIQHKPRLSGWRSQPAGSGRYVVPGVSVGTQRLPALSHNPAVGGGKQGVYLLRRQLHVKARRCNRRGFELPNQLPDVLSIYRWYHCVSFFAVCPGS